jgi:hypothetical protein
MGWAAAIQGGAAVLGAVQGRKSAKEARSSIERDRADRMEGYNFSKPYIQRSYDRAEGALNDSLEQGAYTGQTYAGMNPYATAGNNFMGNAGMYQGAQGFGIANQGANFANNYADLFEAGKADRMGIAQDYATNNSQGLVDAAMRDPYRNLTENTLPGINRGASGAGNMNSSRAGMADAIATRGYNDRQADVSSGIQNQLMNQSLGEQQQQFSNMMGANQGLFQGYGAGMNAMQNAGNWMTGAGNNFRNQEQGYYNDQRGRYEDQRDFGLNQNIKYQEGILDNAVYNTTPGITPMKPTSAMGALGGLQSGFSMGNQLAGYLPPKAPKAPPAPTGGGGGYGGGYRGGF